ncbi:hypothetical protein DL765_011480 [Monosporascus sp. GIB2]|nr:hypothetical protein DL765_011480 [Monosporascus sp. GIB2]
MSDAASLMGISNGRAASELSLRHHQEANQANGTFHKNKEHIACVFKDLKFFLDTGGSLPFDLNLDQPGTLCAFAEGIPGGGPELGQIRSLSRLGRLEFYYKNSAICQLSCIAAEGYLRVPENATGGGEDKTFVGSKEKEVSDLGLVPSGGQLLIRGGAFLIVSGMAVVFLSHLAEFELD